MRYSIESDIELLEAGGCSILSWTQTRSGYVILWYDDRGFTNTVRRPKSSSVGGTLSFVDARTEYMQHIQELLDLGGNNE